MPGQFPFGRPGPELDENRQISQSLSSTADVVLVLCALVAGFAISGAFLQGQTGGQCSALSGMHATS